MLTLSCRSEVSYIHSLFQHDASFIASTADLDAKTPRLTMYARHLKLSPS
jgi:hypothetical protein